MTKITTKEAYEAIERLAFCKQLDCLKFQPLADRQAAQKDCAGALMVPGRMVERTEWILSGDYGHGAFLHAKDVARSRLMNRAAWFSQVIAALDSSCPQREARAAFMAIPEADRTRINAEIEKAIEDWNFLTLTLP